MQVYKTKWFVRFARRERISDASLREAVQRAERGLIDADLGDGLIKQRVARSGQGRSGGYRMLLAYKARQRLIFLYGFAKNEQANLTPDQLRELHVLTARWLSADDKEIRTKVEDGSIAELEDGKKSS